MWSRAKEGVGGHAVAGNMMGGERGKGNESPARGKEGARGGCSTVLRAALISRDQT